MNEMQKTALEKTVEGHNILLLGQSGTGKRYVVMEIARQLSDRGICVSKTGTTGMAALQIEGITLHRWSGYGDGRLSGEELQNKIENDEHFDVYKTNIMNTDCLIVDEIDMMSCKMFQDIEYVCRKIKNPNKYFGGIQVIGVGDFFQLPPVPDHYTQDTGDFCFKSSRFHLVFPHIMTLTEVMRQNQQDLIQAIHEIARGRCSVETIQLIHRLNRKLPPGEIPVRLCGRRFDCEIHNALQLMELVGELYTYKSTSEGKSNALDNLVVPHVICLKVGCPVLLVKNLSNTLVNGLRGIVRECRDDSVIVEFSGTHGAGEKLCTIKREMFTVYDNTERKVVASRYQIPLILAYSITIHKAQGLTLDRVEVDASNIFAPGQLGVALGRATSKKGLRVVGFKAEQIIPMSEDVFKFYTYVPAGFTESFECCKYDVTFVNDLINDEVFDNTNSSEDTDFSDSEIYEVDQMLQTHPISVPENSNVAVYTETEHRECLQMPFEFSKLQSLLHLKSHSPEQANILQHLQVMFECPEFRPCVRKLYDSILEIFNSKCCDFSVKMAEPKTWTSFYSEVYKFSTEEKYTQILTEFLKTSPKSEDYSAFGKVFDKLCEIILEQSTSHLTGQTSSKDQQPLTEAGGAKIRYLGGRCVAKCKYHNMKSAKANLYHPKKLEKVNKAFFMVKCLDSVTMRSTKCMDSSYTSSLAETERKQNISRGLTHINDSCYEFFLQLNVVRMKHQTEQNLHIHGSEVLNTTKSAVLNDQDLITKWRNTFHEHEEHEDILHDLFIDIVGRFLRISDNQFRKDCLRNMGKKKTQSLRKEVVKEKSSSDAVPVPEPVEAGTSRKKKTGKKVVHDNDGNESHSTERLSTMPARSSSSQRKRSAPAMKSKKKTKKNTTYCMSCSREYNEQEQWIQCDTCNNWYDRYCQHISETDFEKLSEDDMPWNCNECSQ